jgi:hypothetical protein
MPKTFLDTNQFFWVVTKKILSSNLVIEKFQLPIVETNFDSKNLVAKRNG